MPRKKPSKQKKHKKVGIEGLVEPGVGARAYVRGQWMKKLDELDKKKRKQKHIKK